METIPTVGTELTLNVIDEGAARRFWARRTLDQYQLLAQKTTQQHTVYLDTAPCALAQQGQSISVAIVNQSKQQICYASHQDTHVTPICTYPLTSSHWPNEILTRLAAAHIDAHTLMPIIHVIHRRHIRQLCDVRQQMIAILTLDQGIIYASGHQEAFCEIEVSVPAETPVTQRDDIIARIQQLVPSMIGTTHKYMRGMHLLASAQPSTPDTSMHQHLSLLQGTQRAADEALFIPIATHDTPTNRVISACALQLIAHQSRTTEPLWLALAADAQAQVDTLVAQHVAPAYTMYGAALSLHQLPFGEGLRLQLRHQFRRMLIRRMHVLADFDQDHIHRLRVILRKIRALLECADGCYDEELLNQYKRGFRRMARFLGEVRDCDVLLGNMQRIGGVDGIAPEITRAIAQTRTQALHDLDELFRSDKHQRFILEYAAFVSTPAAAAIDGVAQTRLADVLGHRIAERTVAFQQPLPQTFDRVEEQELHAWRIRGKRLRYILECFPTVIIAETTPALTTLDAVQHSLGMLQDTVVAFELLNKMKVHTHPDSKKVITQLRHEAAQQRQALTALWQASTSSAFNDAIFATITAMQ
jgi:CHAD domain-containing protein